MHFKCMFVQTKNRLKAKFVCKADVPTTGPKRVTQPHPKERCAENSTASDMVQALLSYRYIVRQYRIASGSCGRRYPEVFRAEAKIGERISIKSRGERGQRFPQRRSQATMRRDRTMVVV
jgi:hypothetical protein